MHAARNARQKTTCKISVAVVGRRRVVGRRAVSSELREAVDRRLRELQEPDCKRIAEEFGVSHGFVWVRAQVLGVALRKGRRPGARNLPLAPGQKRKPRKPSKPRTNTLHSAHRDEVLRLLAEGKTKTEIAGLLGLSRQWVHKLTTAVDPEEIQALRDGNK